MNKITPEIKKLIEANVLALATINNSDPHCIAVGYPRVISENQIILSVIYMRETIENITNNNKVALAVWSKEWEKSCEGYELKGSAEYFKSGKWKVFIDNLPENEDENSRGAILVTVEKIKKLA